MQAAPPRKQVARFILASLISICGAAAQTPGTGAISGVVTDSTNHVVANAEIKTINTETHLSRVVRTISTGVFRVALLPPGTYEVSATMSGFAIARSQAVVTVSVTTSMNMVLSVSDVKQSVTVTNSVDAAELDSSTLGGLVDESAVQSLPLSNRNYTQILGLSPGVVVNLPNAAELGKGTQNVASNGATPTANNIQFNGIDANNLAENSAANAGEEVGTAIPSPDSIQEFRVQTANFDAAYGRGSGANVDLVSKSGSNHLHGSAWEFVRNNLLNANDFFIKQNGQPRPDLKQNQFGASLGGPILKERTFLFLAYQGTTEVNGLGGKTSSTLPLLTSDRSAATLGAQFCPAGHLDAAGQPASGYLTHARGTQVACDGSNINPVALAILNAKLPNGQLAVPSPQAALQVTDSDQLPVGQSTFAPPAHFREDQFSVDLDQVVSAHNSVSARFFYSRAPTIKPFSPSAANVPGWGTDERDRNTMFVLADTHIFNSNLVNVARAGFIRFDGLSAVQNPLLAQAIGEGTPTGAADPAAVLPGLTIDGLFTIGDAGTPAQWQVTNSFIYQDTVAITRGRQNIRVGAEYKRHQVDENAPFSTSGLLDINTFDDFLLGQSAAQNGSPQGLSNVTLAFAGGGIYRRNTRYNDFSSFVQDDVKLTQRLTLNAGLRYEIFGAPTETHGILTNFDPAIASGPVPAGGTFSGYTVPSNFQSTIPSGVLKTSYAGLWKTPYGNVSPRLGFVWQMSGKPELALRGGYGWYFDRHAGNLAEQTASQAPYATFQVGAGAANGPATLQSPFTPLILPNSSYPIFMPRTPDSAPFIEATDPNVKDGKTEEYNLDLQYAFAKNFLLDAGYVGTRSLHRPGQLEFDQAVLAGPGNPVHGETTNSVNNVTARLPFQGVSQGSLLTASPFIGNYNSLQISLSKRMQHNFQFRGSYTWSKNLDEVNGEGGLDTFELQLPTNNQLNLRQGYGLANDDRDQRAVLNFTWQSPRMTGRSRMERYAIANWQFSGIGVIQSGSALTITDNNAGSVYGLLGGEVRAQRTLNNPSTSGSLFSRVNGHYLNSAAFTRAPEVVNGTSLADQDFGNSGVGIVRGPGQHNLDGAVERLFPVNETSSFRFRAEFFNLTNTPQFSNPGTNINFGDPNDPTPTANASFGKITGTATAPRIIQFAMKYTF